jgi:integrase/recombinase XerD
MEKLFQDFLKEKRFLQNLSARTLRYYEWIFNRWQDYVGEFPNKQNIKEFIIKVQESGVSVFTANSYIRGMNAFFTWLHENDRTPEKLRIKKLKEPQRVLKLFSELQLRAFLTYRPKTFAQHRLHALTCVLIDTGCRIDELLSLKRESVDFDNLVILVKGKGDKERIVPISIECRKVLFRYFKMHSYELAFPIRGGDKWTYRTALEQFKDWCEELGITGVRCSFHTIRHTFASAYLRDGGNLIYLQRLLGHADLQSTQIYVNTQPSDLKLMHKKTSLVTKLR